MALDEPQPEQSRWRVMANWLPWSLLAITFVGAAHPAPHPAVGQLAGFGVLALLAGAAWVWGRFTRPAVSVDGVSWLGRRPQAWADIRAARAVGRGFVIDTADGEVWLPRWLSRRAWLVDEVLRRKADAPPASATVDASAVHGWLGLSPGECMTLPRGRRALVSGAGLFSATPLAVLLIAALVAHMSGDEVSAVLTMACAMLAALLLLAARPGPTKLSGQGIEADLFGLRLVLPWHQLVALRDTDRDLVLVTTFLEVPTRADAPQADVLRRTCANVLAEREAAGWAATPSPASLSPAERLTGDEERGLSAPLER